MTKATYLDHTFNSRNPLVRFSHRTRFKNCLKSIDTREDLKLLDFGCGDGLFLNQLKQSTSISMNLLGFEPYMDSVAGNEVRIVKSWEEVSAEATEIGGFDYVTCFEVLEHFSLDREEEALSRMSTVVKDDGMVVVSVPIEQGLPAVVKNLFRRFAHPQHRQLYSYKNIAKSLFSKSFQDIRSGDGYLNHMGFYFRDLEKIFDEKFQIQKRFFSPIPLVGRHINSQVFYQLRKK